MGMLGKIKRIFGFEEDVPAPSAPSLKSPPTGDGGLVEPSVRTGRVKIPMSPEFEGYPSLAPLISPAMALTVMEFLRLPKVLSEAKLMEALGSGFKRPPLVLGVPGLTVRLVLEKGADGSFSALVDGDGGKAQYSWGYAKDNGVILRLGNELEIVLSGAGAGARSLAIAVDGEDFGYDVKKGSKTSDGVWRREPARYDRQVVPYAQNTGYYDDEDSLAFMMMFPDLAVWRNPTSMRAWAVWYLSGPDAGDEFRVGDTVVRMGESENGRQVAYVEGPEGSSQFECRQDNGALVVESGDGRVVLSDPAGDCSMNYGSSDRGFDWSADSGLSTDTPVHAQRLDSSFEPVVEQSLEPAFLGAHVPAPGAYAPELSLEPIPELSLAPIQEVSSDGDFGSSQAGVESAGDLQAGQETASVASSDAGSSGSVDTGSVDSAEISNGY